MFRKELRTSLPPRQQLPRSVVIATSVLALCVVTWTLSRVLLPERFLGSRPLLGNHWAAAIAEAVIGVSCVLISVMVAWLAFKVGSRLPYVTLYWVFCVFSATCGTTYFLEALSLWYPVDRLSNSAKLVTRNHLGRCLCLARPFFAGHSEVHFRNEHDCGASRQ